MLTHIALLGLALLPAPARRYSPIYRPRIELWTNRGDAAVFTRGERVRVYFRLDQDAYVTIFRVDTDGRVRVLFPREPWEDNFARGGREFEIDGQQLHSDAFTIDDYPGVGYLFAVAAADPFIYDGIQANDHWDYRVIADGRVRGDPYVAMTDLAQRIVPEGYADWDYDVVSYNVEQHYDYPRFLCYDCHSYVSYSYWNPYHASCVRFRMYVYDDPWYYPYRYYGGGRVVFVRPYRPQPRFIFKDWGSSRPNRNEFVTRERERPVNDNTRRGVTGRDLGGRGVIPPPAARERPVNDNIRREVIGGREVIPSPDGRDRRDSPARDRTGDRPDLLERPDRPSDASRFQQPRVQPTARGDQRKVEPRVVEPRREEPRRVEPRQVAPRGDPRRDEPRRVEPRAEPRRGGEQVRQPRSEPRAEPRREPARSEPRAESRRSSPPPPPSPARNEPEVRRRKP